MTSVNIESGNESLHQQMLLLGKMARQAARVLEKAEEDERNAALRAAAAEVSRSTLDILKANSADMESARDNNLSGALLDRLALDEARINAMASGIEDIARLPDPVGKVIDEWQRPNGLRIQRVRVPLGVIGIIYLVINLKRF